MHPILIGYRCCGKTSIGKRLAKRLGIEFLDTDEMVQAREKKSIDELVAQKGWAYFRALESRALLDAVSAPRAVIATGGGMVLAPENRKIMAEKGDLIRLTADVKTILNRINADEASHGLRPRFDPRNSLEVETREQLALRDPLYRQLANLTIDTGVLSPEGILDKIMEALDHGRL